MRKFLTVFMLFLVIFTMTSCVFTKTDNPIDYGKKYCSSDKNYYVFNKDQTGYRVYYYKYESSNDSKYNYTLSGRVEFVWREASDGGIYLFATKETYNDDHTEGKTIGVISNPLYFSDDFFTYTYVNSYGDTTVKYIKEGSALEKILDKD